MHLHLLCRVLSPCLAILFHEQLYQLSRLQENGIVLFYLFIYLGFYITFNTVQVIEKGNTDIVLT